MDDTARLLDQTLRSQGIPILGVTIGIVNDRATWIVQYDGSASAAQLSAGESIRATFDATAPAVVTADVDRQSTQAVSGTAVKAMCALVLDASLNRRLTQADIPTVQAMFNRYQTYFKFIVNNGL